MAPGANSYGTAAQVAALTRRYTTAGAFDGSTNPGLSTVEDWIDTVSAIMNTSLAAAGFAIPITQADAASAVRQVVIAAVCDLVHAANSAGRFYTEKALERGLSPIRVITREMGEWVEAEADGLESLGASRTRSLGGGILSRGSDQAGNATAPIFQRGAFGNSFTDWDK